MEKDRISTLELFVAVGIALLFFWFGWNAGKKETTDKPTTDTVILTYVDTFYFERPTEVVRYITRHDTIVCTDTTIKIVIDTISGDSTAIIPIERAIYQDSTQNAKYTAYLSGFRANLDSIQINCLQTETIITKIEREKARKFGFGVQLGVGLSPQGIAAPYLGVGVQYRIW
jgi:hypothetical protein